MPHATNSTKPLCHCPATAATTPPLQVFYLREAMSLMVEVKTKELKAKARARAKAEREGAAGGGGGKKEQ